MKIKPSYKTIEEISAYTPGETALSKQNSNNPKRSIKLSSNENPFGCSPQVKKAIEAEFDNLHRYSDGGCNSLRVKISEAFGLDKQKVVCGAGSDELITVLCMAYAAGEGSQVLYSEFGFLMYPITARTVGATPVKASENNLHTNVDEIISSTNDKTKIIFIANPNNPTGSYITESEIERLIKKVPDNIIIVLDAAYQEYAEVYDDFPDHYKIADKYNNVVVLRTFSKAYGIPNLRLGWAYSNNPEIIDVMNRIRGPFNVSGVAQVAALAGSNEIVAKVDEYLRSNGVTGRLMVAYGLPTCMRFTIGLEEENEFLLKCLSEVL